jgi:hypothetical protein
MDVERRAGSVRGRASSGYSRAVIAFKACLHNPISANIMPAFYNFWRLKKSYIMYVSAKIILLYQIGLR